MRKILFFALLILVGLNSIGQISGTKSIPGDYATIAAAVSALNTSGVGTGGVVFNVAANHTETAPAGGIVLGSATLNASLSSSKQVVFQKSGTGNNPLITAFTPGTTTTTDGIWKIAGADYITIDGIDLTENASNTTATQQMEWGFALVKRQSSAPFDGCQYITIKNCNISLNRANTASVGIYAGNHTAISTTALTITAVGDANSYNKFFNNTISNVYTGISLNGFNHSSSPYGLYDQNNEIGVDGANTISNYSGSTATSYGIYGIYQNNIKIANNIISNGNGHSTTLYGIMLSTATNASYNIYNNNVTLQSAGTTSQVVGIYFSAGGSGTNNIVNVYNNKVQGCSFSTLTSATFYGYYMTTSSPFTFNFYNNEFKNNSYGNGTTTATGAIYPIYLAGTGNTNTGSYWKVYNNDISGNSRNQSTPGTGAFYALYVSGYGMTTEIYNNNIYNNNMPTTTSTQYLLYAGGTSTITKKIYGNNINNHIGGGAIYGIYNTGGNASDIYKNNINNITNNASAGTIYGIYQTTGTTSNIYNNYISQLYTPNSTSSPAIYGAYLITATNVNMYYNTIYLDAVSNSTSNFGTTAIFANTSVNVDFRNNIFVNKSQYIGTGRTVAYQRSSTTLTSYSSNSNNNCFYVENPDANTLIFYDGTNSDQTIDSYQTRVSPRDGVSFSAMPPFADVSNSPYDLAMQTGVPTKFESGGIAIAGYNDDYFGNARYPNAGYPEDPMNPATAPDVGAEEFAGIPTFTCNTPTPGNTLISNSSICLGESVTFSLENQTIGTGVSY